MSQQINLRPAIARQRPLTLLSLLALLAYLGFLSIISNLQFAAANSAEAVTNQLRSEEQALIGRLQQIQRGDVSEEQVAALTLKRDELRKQLGTNEALVKALQDGALGLRVGHSKRLQALAAASETGVWLESIRFADSGREAELIGKSTGFAEVYRYSERVGRAMEPFGVLFGPASVASSGEQSDSPGSGPTFNFTLR